MSFAKDLWCHVLFGEGENERQKQTCCATSRNSQGLDYSSGREDQRIFGRISARTRQEMGRIAQYIHARFRRPLQRAILLDADHRRRAHCPSHIRLYRHYPQDGKLYSLI